MDAQAVGISGAGDPARLPTFAVGWRWSLLLGLGFVLAEVALAVTLGDVSRARAYENTVILPSCRGCTPMYADAWGLAFVGMIAIVLAAIVSIPAFVVLVLLGRRVRVAASALAATGLLAGVLMAGVAGRLVDWAAASLGTDAFGSTIASVVVGPTIEETTKVGAVLIVALVAGWRLGLRAGIVLGAVVGLWTTIFEIALYVQLAVAGGNNTGYGGIIALRLGLLGLGPHVVATAIGGAGAGAWLARPRPRPPWLLLAGLAMAIVVHGAWNLAGSTLMTAIVLRLAPDADLGAPEPFPLPVLFIASSVTQLVILAIPIAGLVVAWRRDAARAAPTTEAGVEPVAA